MTESLIQLVLVEEESFEMAATDENDIMRRSTLLFNHNPTPKPTHQEIKLSRELLKKMCSFGFPNIQRDFIDAFTQFLQAARFLSHEAMHELLMRAESICTNGKYVTTIKFAMQNTNNNFFLQKSCSRKFAVHWQYSSCKRNEKSNNTGAGII